MAPRLLLPGVFALLAVLVGGGLACSCLPATIEEHFASSDAALRIEVVAGPVDIGLIRLYLVHIIDVYKGAYGCGDLAVLKTTSSSAACGVELQYGHQYVITAQSGGAIGPWAVLLHNQCMFNREFCALDGCHRPLLERLRRCKDLDVCPDVYAPVCATCNGRRRTFSNRCEARSAGWRPRKDGACEEVEKRCLMKCRQVGAPYCLWGTPRCCRDGTWSCPSGGNPQRPKSWEYSCRKCTKRELNGRDYEVPDKIVPVAPEDALDDAFDYAAANDIDIIDAARIREAFAAFVDAQSDDQVQDNDHNLVPNDNN